MIIGLTGGIASGKTTVSNLLERLGAAVIDADRIAHEVLRPGEKGWQEVINYFGREIVTPSGKIDRSRLGSIIFNDPAEREKLEEITHPLIINEIERGLAVIDKGIQPVVLDAPLLYEAGLEDMVDQVWVVYVDYSTQLKRLQQRDDLSKDKAAARIKSQLPLKRKWQKADVVIDNTGSKRELRAQVIKLWEGVKSLPKKRIALIAHDEKKPTLIEYARKHKDLLQKCHLIATGTTGQLLMDEVDLDVERMNSGPLGGDQMIGAEVARERVDGVIFLRDPLTAQPHEPDITALLRVCDVHNIPLATNLATADIILHGIINK